MQSNSSRALPQRKLLAHCGTGFMTVELSASSGVGWIVSCIALRRSSCAPVYVHTHSANPPRRLYLFVSLSLK